MSIERIKDDIHVRTKIVDLRIRSGEIIVTRLFDQPMHHPLVLFSVKDGSIEPCSPSKAKILGDSVVFDTDSDVHGNMKTNGRDALLIQLECYDNKVGFMFPTADTACYFGDQIEPINKRFTTIAMYRGQSDDPTHQHLPLPMLHLVDKSCLTVSTDSVVNSAEFCHFIHSHSPYFNVISNEKLKASLRCFGNQRGGLSHFYQNFGYVQPLPVSGRLDLLRMKRALYLNSPIEETSVLSHIRETAREIQRRLDQSKIQNCVIGSLAVAMHRSDIEVLDIDVAVNDLSLAKEEFKDCDIVTASSGKWKDCSFRIYMHNKQVDIVELKRFNWDAVTEVKGLRVLNKDGLLLMKLMGEFERSLMQPNYDVFKFKNQNSILSLFDSASYVYPFFVDFLRLDVEQDFHRLKDLINDAEWEASPLSVTFPLHANAFTKGRETFIPVINNGSPCSGKISIQKQIQSASWVALDGHDTDCRVDVSHESSQIHLPVINDAGVTVCQHV